MYEIYTDGNKLIYSPRAVDSGYIATSAKITYEVNKAGTLIFTIPASNPMYSNLAKLKSTIYVYLKANQNGVETTTEIWRGRILDSTRDFYNNKKITCEGELAFLNDGILSPYDYTTGGIGISSYIEMILNTYNSQCSENRKIYLGNIQFTGTIYRGSESYVNCLSELTDKVTDNENVGGYLNIRHGADGKSYLDLHSESISESSQKIEFGRNMLDFEEYIDASSVFTYLIPLGARDESTDKPIDITSVNDGKNYVMSETGVALYGNIYRTYTWDDVTIPSNLLTKAKKLLADSIAEATTLTIPAVDMHLLDVTVEKISIGNKVRVQSIPHNIDEDFVCTKIVLDLLAPDQSEYTFGLELSSSSSNHVNSIKDQEKKLVETNDRWKNAVKNVTQMMTGSNGGYKITEYDENGKWLRDLYMDTDNKETATNIMQVNMNGIGFSQNGYDGPYESAWTIDGGFVANWITAGEMSANRIHGGEILSTNYDATTGTGMRIDLDNARIDTQELYVDDYIQYNANGLTEGDTNPIKLYLAGFQIKHATVYGEPAEYWETKESQENGIGAYGPWVVWGGWNGQGAFNKDNYNFVVTEDGDCKAMSWTTGSKAEFKEDIKEYEDGALNKVLDSTVYRYKLKKHGKDTDGRHIGFVIGSGYNVTPDLLDYQKSSVDMYSAIGIAYKAIQELNEQVQNLKERLKKYE
jgi:hypothetical protein|nr:MAG TPA: tail protein [Caudoviricetes sp.]